MGFSRKRGCLYGGYMRKHLTVSANEYLGDDWVAQLLPSNVSQLPSLVHLPILGDMWRT
jgi:hypothetical protein